MSTQSILLDFSTFLDGLALGLSPMKTGECGGLFLFSTGTEFRTHRERASHETKGELVGLSGISFCLLFFVSLHLFPCISVSGFNNLNCTIHCRLYTD